MGDELPLGAEVDWTPAKPPSRAPLLGSHVLLRPVDAVADAEALYAVSHPPEGDPAIWTYLPYGPYEHPDQMRVLLDWAEKSDDPLFFALVGLADERPAGLASYRITPEFGVIEIGQSVRDAAAAHHRGDRGHLPALPPRVRRPRLPPARVEVQRAERRVTARRRALWLSLRGRLSQPHGGQGRNRDAAWYAITNEEWPAIRPGYEAWLAPQNFESDSRQKRALGELVEVARR